MFVATSSFAKYLPREKAELGDEVELSLEKVDVILIVLHQLLEQIAAHVVLDCMTMGRGFLVKRARRVPPHVGRGGWTWYTGSAGRMYNVALEWILGFRVRGASFVLDPCHPTRMAKIRDLFPPSLGPL